MDDDNLGIRIGERVYELRDLADLSQKELAARVAVSVTAISRLERGVVIPSVKNLAKIAKALNVGLAELFTVKTETDRNARRRDSLKKLNAMLCQRQSYDVEDVFRIVEMIFEIAGRRKRAPEIRGERD